MQNRSVGGGVGGGGAAERNKTNRVQTKHTNVCEVNHFQMQQQRRRAEAWM